jgi:8-oxo-dGTP diphosphatase
VQWVPRTALLEYDFPAANRPIVTALQLPEKYLITPSPGDDTERFLASLETSLQSGIILVQLRAPELSQASYGELAGKVLSLCQQYDAQLILNSDPVWVEKLSAHGVHLNSQRLMACTARPLAKHFWVGASCHNATEIAQANSIDADFAVLAPVLPTQSHPQADTLGWEALRQLTDMANLPVYALGGMSVQHLAMAHEHGAQGIAAIRSLWSDSVCQE